MRLISPHANFSLQVIEAKEQIVVDPRGAAQSIVLDKPVIANFDVTGLTDWEQDAALTWFDFSGLPDGVSPLTTVSVFDTEAYCFANFHEEERDGAQVKIDKRLRELEGTVQGFRIVEKPEAEKPWPSYDGMKADEIIRAREVLNFSPEKIRLYELENENREEVIEAMLDLEDPSRVEAREAEAEEVPKPKAKTKAKEGGVAASVEA